MTTRLLICCTLLFCANAIARPLVIEAKEQLPFVSGLVGLAGDEMIAMDRSYDDSLDAIRHSANLYHRDTFGQWIFDRTLVSETTQLLGDHPSLAMSSSIAAIVLPSGLHIFERGSAGWTERVLDVVPRPRGYALDLDGATLLATEAGCAARALELKRAANGHWVLATTLPAAAGTCITALALHANAAIVRSQGDIEQPPAVRILERNAGGGWAISANFAGNELFPSQFAQAVAIHGPLAIASGAFQGAYVYRRTAAGWTESGHFENPDGAEFNEDGSIQISDDYILRVGDNRGRNGGVAYLYRERADHTFEHLANLVGTLNTPASRARLAGNRVISLSGGFGTQLLEFNLPSSFDVPALVQDDFESGTAAKWSPLPGSQFTIVSNGTTRVYRQSNLAGDAGSIHATDMTNQSVSADIRLNAVNGADRWVGLMTRYISPTDYYYITLRDSNRIVLRRMLNGVYSDLGSAAINVVPGESYRISLESSGSFHAVDIDGHRVIRAYDAELSHGRAGLRTYKAAADFDNVVVSPGPINNLIYANINATGGDWFSTGGSTFEQGSVAVAARRTTGLPREDQVVQATVNVVEFAGGSTPWVGLIARYRDDNNYYYVTARKANELSLRKLTNGAITVLGTVPMSVAPNSPFVLRLEAVGDRLRVYVNDVLRLEQAGAEVVAGKVGVMTNRAAAKFEQYTAYEP